MGQQKRLLKYFQSQQSNIFDPGNSTDKSKTRKKKLPIASLCNKLIKGAAEISFDDAEILAKIILPIPFGKDEDVFLLDKIMTALQVQLNDVPEGMTEEQADSFYIDKVNEVADDPYEKIRWRIIAGSIECQKNKNLKAFAKHLDIEDLSYAEEIVEDIKLSVLSEGRIDYPRAKYIGEEKTAKEDTQETIILSRNTEPGTLRHIHDRLFLNKPKLDFSEATQIIRCFIDCVDKNDILNHVKIGLKNYEDEVSVHWDVFDDKKEYEEEVINPACEDILDDPAETARWLLFCVAAICRADENKMQQMAWEIGSGIEEATGFVASIEFIADEMRIILEDEEIESDIEELAKEIKKTEIPLHQKIEFFIGNHQVENPKQWPNDNRRPGFSYDFPLN